MCNTSARSIAAACSGGRGGLKLKIWMEAASSVANVPEADAGTNVISSALTFVPADAAATPPIPQGGLSEFAISKYDGNITTTNEGDDENPQFVSTVNFRINRATAEKNNILQDINGRTVQAIVPDGNGTRWMFGDNDEPAVFSAMQESADKNGYVCTISYRYGGDNMLKQYTAAITVDD